MTPTARILVVEDEPAIADAIEYQFVQQGYAVQIVADGESALTVDVDRVDLVMLDVVLPKVSGFEVCREFRARSQVPILMLTVRASETDRAFGLEIGADDYVCKPFSM